MKILVVDDDPGLRAALRRSLLYEGYEVDVAADGVAALTCLQGGLFDAIVLDVAMPRLDGIATCQRIRATGDELPILLLTAKDAVSDRVRGLDAGADDYLVKPFALSELLARIRALLRRRPDGEATPTLLCFADVVMDVGAYEVTRDGSAVRLTRTEFVLLELLLRHPRQVLTKQQILQHVWGFDFETSSNSLEVYVGYLRRKLEDGGQSRLVHTVRGVGYTLRPPP